MIAVHIALMFAAVVCLIIAALFHPASMTGTPAHPPRFSMRFGWAGMALWAIHVLIAIWPR